MRRARLLFPVYILFLPGLILCLNPTPAAAQEPLPPYEPGGCSFEVPRGRTVQCGDLVVPENRARPGGSVVRVAVTIIRSSAPTPAPDPVIYLNGGPGGISQEILDRLDRYQAWLARRDLILFDQRGTGRSKPALDCLELKEVVLRQALGADLSLEVELAPRLACRNRWLDQGTDLAAYNSVEIASDVVDLWRTLGYRQVNLYAVSYGTIPAQLIMRDSAATGDLRGVILDSPVPLAVTAMADTPNWSCVGMSPVSR